MRIKGEYLDGRQGLGLLARGFAMSSMLFFLVLIVCLLIGGWHERPPDSDALDQHINNEMSATATEVESQGLLNEKDSGSSAAQNDAYFMAELKRNMQRPEIDSETIRDLLWEYLEYNKSKNDLISVIDTSIYISKIYFTYDEKIDEALEMAMIEMENTKTLIQELDSENKIKYELENLSMLSSIYRLMGIKNVRERNEYYQKASVCIEELLSKIEPDAEEYPMWLLDLVNLEDERGNRAGAIKILSKWEKSHFSENKELYFKYILILLEDEGNEAEVGRIIEIIESMDSAKEDYRYEKIVQKVYKYLGKERNAM